MDEMNHNKLWAEFYNNAKPIYRQFYQAHQNPIKSVKDFQSRVPTTKQIDLLNWTSQIEAGGEKILTEEPPLFFEPTSGSSARQKLIPYTPALLTEFQRAIIVWLAILYEQCPAIAQGRSYWAMSPSPTSSQTTESGLPIGGYGDAVYLQNSIALPLLQSVVNPPHLDTAPEQWKLNSLIALIDAADLSMISVWSPTFLIALLKPLIENDNPESQHTLDLLFKGLPTKRRDATVAAIAAKNLNILWPNLVLISCWMDGPSKQFAQTLVPYFPDARFSPKGLLATEGVVSISWATEDRCPLALDSHFLEFVADDGSIVLADNLQVGECYRPLLTTSGGLYRYSLNDVIQIADPVDGLISARFLGRTESTSDLVGEKLDENLSQMACEYAQSQGFNAVLVPNASATIPHYVLLSDCRQTEPLLKCQAATEQALMKIHHYKYARDVNQLGPLTSLSVPDLASVLQRAWETSGLRAGDYKPSYLIHSLQLAAAVFNEASLVKENSIVCST